MARIGGVEIPNEKRIEISLTYIYGIGRSSSKKILHALNLNFNKKAKDLTEDEIKQINRLLADSGDYVIEGELSNLVSLQLKRLKDINCNRGQRHERKLPVRGQRTKNNCRTRKGRKKIAVAGKKKPTK